MQSMATLVEGRWSGARWSRVARVGQSPKVALYTVYSLYIRLWPIGKEDRRASRQGKGCTPRFSASN
jgi:hypothetical protein